MRRAHHTPVAPTTRPLRIGIVCYPTYGGSGVVATELGKGLADRGHQVHFVSYSQPFRLENFHENIFYHEVSVEAYPLFEHPPYILSLAGKLLDVAKFQKLDLIHVHYAIPHATAAVLTRQMLQAQGIYVPIITTLHGTDITLVGQDNLFEPIVSLALNQSDGVTAVSESLRQDTYKHFAVARDIEVIPNFVDIDRFQRTRKNHFRKAIAPNDECILIHTSNFRQLKRVDLVIRIFESVRKVLPCKLLLIGDGPERQKAENLSRELRVSEDVRFLGKQEAVEELLSIADVFLMPSESESFGLAALEAMACQVPVVSSNAGGIPEVNIENETGFVLEIGDWQGMADKVLDILQNDALLERLRTGALAQAKAHALEHILPLYEAQYCGVLERAEREQLALPR